ncbi:thioredoxin family protein [Polyangium aurulentum]|uniref:thioredoxin family protein n=1 Tax=Polyangium aurulentum TaxID=2567896 RepID=UPI0010AEB9ED|nr:thioredoxin family protein [Polyangium aurulentum]UQA62773.1 thioredoxin family protein [Polyangium aurulentum]
MKKIASLAALALPLLAAACTKPSATTDTAGTTAAPATPSPAPSPATAAAPAAEAALGKPAPDFTLRDLEGKEVHLADFKGKTVVLEWFNPECPFVKHNHTKGPLKDMAKRQLEKGVVWLAINSGAPGKQGHGAEVNKKGKETYGIEHPILLDEEGSVGKRYGAQRTPHMYVVDPQGTLVYRGAIDNAPDGDPTEGDKVINYVEAALADVEAKRPVAKPETEAYGCTVKYASK